MWKSALIAALIITACVLAVKLSIGNTDVWGPYYYRQAGETFQQQTTNYVDTLSYLGRTFTYPPAFFEFAAQSASLAGAGSFAQAELPIHAATVLAFFFSVYLLFLRLKGERQRILAFLLFATQTFVFITSVSTTLHVFAYLMLNASVILFLERKGRLGAGLSTLALAMAFSSHPTSIFLFPLLAYVCGGFRISLGDLVRTAVICVAAVSISLIFYVPIFLRAGLPYEIIPQTWGYLLTYGLDGMKMDFQFTIPLLAIALLCPLWRKDMRVPAAMLAVFILINAYVSFRINVAIAATISMMLPAIFERRLKDNLVFAALLLFPLANLLLQPVIYSGTVDYCTWGTANRMCVAPMEYIRENAQPGEAVALNPFFGHLEAYYGGHPIVADLYVEYADYGKWKAENDFYERGDTAAVERYGATLFVLDDASRERDLPGGYDRIYDNGYMHAYRRAGPLP